MPKKVLVILGFCDIYNVYLGLNYIQGSYLVIFTICSLSATSRHFKSYSKEEMRSMHRSFIMLFSELTLVAITVDFLYALR
jgi:hypothetical protein